MFKLFSSIVNYHNSYMHREGSYVQTSAYNMSSNEKFPYEEHYEAKAVDLPTVF